jgi:hypothetical protein
MEDRTVGPLKILTDSELDDVRKVDASQQKHLIIAGFVDYIMQELVLFRADESELVAPFSLFEPAHDGTLPDFDHFEIIDSGHTIKLGIYEASSSGVIYDLDPEYKAFCNANRMTN